jgi:hypothetical protein
MNAPPGASKQPPTTIHSMTKSNLPSPYSRKDLDNARTKGQLIGWLQGGAVAVVGMILVRLIGWIPTIAVVAIGGFVIYKLFSRPSRES